MAASVSSGNLFNNSNLLYAALIFYSGAGTLYLAFGITGVGSYIRFASFFTWAGLAANTVAVAHRMMFTFFGVTYLLPGLHAYAWPT